MPEGYNPIVRTFGYVADYAAHRGSGHQWTRNEIACKIRVVVAEALNLRLGEVRLESGLRKELGM